MVNKVYTPRTPQYQNSLEISTENADNSFQHTNSAILENNVHESWGYKIKNACRITNHLLQSCVGEMVGIYIYFTLTFSNLATFYLYKDADMSHLGVAIASGLNLTFGMYISSYICNSHLNPMISFCDFLECNITFWDFVCFGLHHILGAFIASWTVFGIYYNKIDEFYPGENILQLPIFAQYKQLNTSNTTAFFTEFTGATFMVLGYFIFFKHEKTVKNAPAYIGALLTAIILAFGFQTTSLFNISKNIGTRIMITMLGYNAFTFADMYFWIPIVGNICGSLFGLAFYNIFFKFQIL